MRNSEALWLQRVWPITCTRIRRDRIIKIPRRRPEANREHRAPRVPEGYPVRNEPATSDTTESDIVPEVREEPTYRVDFSDEHKRCSNFIADRPSMNCCQ